MSTENETWRDASSSEENSGAGRDGNQFNMALKDFRAISSLFDEDVYDALALKTCVNERKVYGGPAKESVQKQIELIRQFVGEHTK